MWETCVRSLGWEEYWKKGMATHSGIHSSGQSFSHVQLFMAPWTAACQAFLSINNSWTLLKLMSTESVMPSNHCIICCPRFFLPSIFPYFQSFPASGKDLLRSQFPFIRWPKYWSFSFSINLSNIHWKYSGLIYFMIDWFDLLVVQGTLKSLLQHHSSKASILRCSISL